MSDQQRDWLARLAQRIPGYGGYVERERRRDVDKLQREHLADQLRALKTPLTDAMRELTNAPGGLSEIGPLERLVKKLDRIENRVRFATYGYAGFFDVTKVEEQQLESLYRFDLALVERTDALAAKVRELQTKAAGDAAGALKTAVGEAERALDELNQTFDERHSTIDSSGGGDGSQGARSLFDA
jgi:hypothetical protein